MLPAHMKAEAASGRVRIDGKHMPRHGVGSPRQGSDTDTHHIAADALALVYTRARGIAHLCPAELRLELLREVERHLSGGACDCAADPWARMIEKGMRMHRR